MISTCSKCNQTKTETIPALGHTWTVDCTVQTAYDEQGKEIDLVVGKASTKAAVLTLTDCKGRTELAY